MKCLNSSNLTSFLTASGDLRLLTVKSRGDKLSKLSQIQKLCARIADTYFIVRENNVKTAGFHYHAVLRLNREPPRNWFKKGIHMHLTKIGRSDKPCVAVIPDITSLKQIEKEILIGQAEPQELEDEVVKRTMERQVQKRKRLSHIERVLLYLLKSFNDDNPLVQYRNYQLIVKKKNLALPPPTPLGGGREASSPLSGEGGRTGGGEECAS